MRGEYYSYLSILLIITLGVATPLIPAKAQKPILVQNQDTTYFIKKATLDDIEVTAKRSQDQSTLGNLVTSSELNTSVSGITKDLQRDLPSMIRLYTPQGIPMLTKYTSNNSLTSTIPDSAVKLELKEPSAKFPNPDAPVIISPSFHQQNSISLSPLNQAAVVASDTQETVTRSLALSRSGAAPMFEELISEMRVYNTTYSGYGGLNLNLPKSRSEIIFHLSNSQNEFGELLGIEELQESDRSANLFAHSQYDLDKFTLHAGFAHQDGREHRQVKELRENNQILDYEVINEIKVTSLTAAISNSSTELRANFHDLHRIYTYGVQDSVHLQRWEAVLSHQQELTSSAELSTEARYDFIDREPSVSGNLQVRLHPKLMINLNAARLYDAVGSEGLNNLRRSVQTSPHPWEAIYLRLGANFYREQSSFNVSITRKKVRRGWYGETADTYGWIGRLGANGILYKANKSHYLRWDIEGVVRSMNLAVSEQPSKVLPGPAKLEGHTSLEAVIGKMKYSILADIFVDRHMRINQNVTGNLGTQSFLSIAALRQIGIIKLETRLSNGLDLLGKENRIVAHHTKTGDMTYVSAPPVINLSVGINF